MAHADHFALNTLYTNDCATTQARVLLLSHAKPEYDAQVGVSAVCSPKTDQGYKLPDGTAFDFIVYTTVTYPGTLAPGVTIDLGPIYTNDCATAQREASYLTSDTAPLTATCSDYKKGGYQAPNGQFRDYMMSTKVTVTKPN